MYYGLPTDEFISEAAQTIHKCAANGKDESDAVLQFTTSLTLAADGASRRDLFRIR